MTERCPPNNRVLDNYGHTKKVVKDLDNDVIHMDCCHKGCMLFVKNDSNHNACQFCGHSRWKTQRSPQRNQNPLPYVRMHYLQLKPQLQRLYASRSITEVRVFKNICKRESKTYYLIQNLGYLNRNI